ncbi:MAG: hypothetical protein ACKO97_06275, partial [Actinomycetota bacterium]
LRVRDALWHDNTDLWAASELRESSLWRDSTLFDQISELIEQSSVSQQHVDDRDQGKTESSLPLSAWLRTAGACAGHYYTRRSEEVPDH